MYIKAEIILSYDNDKKAKYVQNVIKIDDGIFVTSKVKKNNIHAHIENDSLSSFLHTIDDYLNCVSVAEKILESKEHK